MSDIPKYPVEDELFSARSGGLQKEIEADLKTLNELNFGSFLKEGHSLYKRPQNDEDDMHHENDMDSVDEDDFFLDNEESNREDLCIPEPSGPLLQKCFKTVLGVELMQTRIHPPSGKVPHLEVVCHSSDSDEDPDDISVDEIFNGFLSDESEYNALPLNRAPLAETLPPKTKVLVLSCPFTAMGCSFRSGQPNAIAQHLKKIHKPLNPSKKCCGSEFQTQMDYDNHIKSAHL